MLSRGVKFFCALLALLAGLAAPAGAEVWRFSGGGLSGGAEVKMVGRTSMAAMDQIAEALGYRVKTDTKDEGLISGPKMGLRLVKGAAVVWLGYSVSALPARARLEQGHWWIESEAALRVMSQFLKKNGRNVTLKWTGSGPRAQKDEPPPLRPLPPENPQGGVSAELPRLKDLRWGGGGDDIRIVADLEGENEPLCAVENGKITLKVAPVGAALARRLVSKNPEIALDVKNGASGVLTFRFQGWTASSFCLSDPFRCVIDLARSAAPPVKERIQKKQEPIAAPRVKGGGKRENQKPIAPKVPLKDPNSKKRKLVVIDAGHGGKDPGAIYRRYREKIIALQISTRIAGELRSRGVDVRMTRTGDTYPTLKQRTAMANEWNADVFLSVHLNALPRGRHASGMEIYIMALPTDRDAMELAKIENAEIAEEGSAADGSTDQRTAMLLSILGNMQQNVKISESTLLAEALFSSGVKSGISMRRVGQAPFWVLRGAAMPAVLIETGFITELAEAKRLSTPAYQTKMAKAIADGVIKFLGSH